MTRVYYVDAAIPSNRKKRRKEKMHVVFDGSRVFRIGKLTELEDASEIFVDTLFPEIYDEVLELLKKGVRAYLLKDTLKLKRVRIENNLRKSDENDAILLARIPIEKFRQLTIEEVEIKARIGPLTRKYRLIVRWKSTLKRLIKRGLNYNFEESVRLMEADRTRISREIIRHVASLPIYGDVYRKACEILGVKNSVELAILVLELPLHFTLNGLKGLLGFTPSKNNRYRRKLRTHITSFAANLYIPARRGVGVSNEVAEVVNHLPKKLALYKLQLMTLKA